MRRQRDLGNKGFVITRRGTGITNYLENGGSRVVAQELAGHEDVRTTALYDRRGSAVDLDELERIRF